MPLPGHLEPDEAIRMGEAMLMTLYGLDLYKRWSDLKVFMGFTLESQFIQWMIEHMEGCQHKKYHHYVNDRKHQAAADTGTYNEEAETIAVGIEINGIESVDDGYDQVGTGTKVDTDLKDQKHQSAADIGTYNEETETVAVGIENFEEINGIESVDDGDDQVGTGIKVETDLEVGKPADANGLSYFNESYSKKRSSSRPMYQCNDCPYTSTKRNNVKRHCERRSHDTHLQVKCPECDKGYDTAFLLNKHIRIVHLKPYRCLMCMDSIGHKRHLLKHLKHKHGISSDKVTSKHYQQKNLNGELGISEEKVISRHYLAQHPKSAHGTSEKTVTRGEKFSTEHNYTNAVSTIPTADARHQCPQCDYSAVHPTRVKLHCKSVHDIELADDFGDEAGNSIQKPQNNSAAVGCRRQRKRLELVKTIAVKQLKCPYCKYRAGIASHIKLHCARVHEQRDDTDRVHQCVYCGKGYFSAQHLKEHTQTVHERTKKFTCNLCTFSSYHRGSFNNHRQHMHARAS